MPHAKSRSMEGRGLSKVVLCANGTGTIDFNEMEATYRISRRIEGEERALDAVSCCFTSTQQEVAEQWGLYDGCVCGTALLASS